MKTIAAAAVLLLLPACQAIDEVDGTREIPRRTYATVDAMLETCAPVRPVVRRAFVDGRIDLAEMRGIRRTFRRAYAERAKAEARADTAAKAGLKPTAALPPVCVGEDATNADRNELADDMSWAMKHADGE